MQSLLQLKTLAHKGLLTKLEKLLAKNGEEVCAKGGRCKFVKLSDQWGAKLYRHKDTRDDCHYLQMLAHQKGVGPRVGIKFETSHDYRSFGYLTQIAVMPFKNYDQRDVIPISRALHKRMFRRGIVTDDLHGWNIGKVNGRWVCIDFDNAWTVNPKIDSMPLGYHF